MLKKIIKASILCLFAVSVSAPGVIAEVHDESETQLLERDTEGTEPDRNGEVDRVLAYIDDNLNDTYQTMYLDYQMDTAVYVFLFTTAVSQSDQDAMYALVDESIFISFEEVAYTKESLLSKQVEIDEAGFDYDDFTINYTGADIINGYVNVAIVPYSEANAQVIYNAFGDDMVKVEQGDAMTTMDMGIVAETAEAEEEELNFFQRIFRAIRSWLPW